MHARNSPKRLIIAAANARPFVRAAVAAGFEAVAVDVFGDVDTRRDAAQMIPLSYTQGGFDAEAFSAMVFPSLDDVNAAFLYGSGFEAQPWLLDDIAQHCTLLGNDAEVVRITKHPDCFFSLLSALDIPFPEFSVNAPLLPDGWLSKSIGGSGGTHVQNVVPDSAAGRYYQRRLSGVPCSLLFQANGCRIRPVGFNRQLLAPSPAMPYRYGGAISQIMLPEVVKKGMWEAASKITSAIGLRGLNSLDCMVEGDCFRVLEVNPRLSATFALYDAAGLGAHLLQSHLKAIAGELTPALPQERAQAHLIHYAPDQLKIPVGMRWSEWVADIPPEGSVIHADEPVCTVMAMHESADAAYALAQLRTTQLRKQINQLRDE